MKCNTLNRECHAEPFAAPSLRSGLRLTQGNLREASLCPASQTLPLRKPRASAGHRPRPTPTPSPTATPSPTPVSSGGVNFQTNGNLNPGDTFCGPVQQIAGIQGGFVEGGGSSY